MAESLISRERFALLVERAGLKLTPERFAELRDGYRLIQRLQQVVRRPRDRAAEPAHIFVHPRAEGDDGPDPALARRGEPRDRQAARLSPVALTEAYLDRIAALDGELHSYVLVLREQALEAARAAEAELAGARAARCTASRSGSRTSTRPEGIRTTAGSRVYLDHVPDEDAETWVRLRNAGAVLLGKQETHEFAIGGPDFTLPFAPARNPWNTAHYPAGSSSGSAAAVGAHLCAAAMGSDTGGSIRGPAAYCGLAGLKPTYGRVSRRGVFPLSYSLDHCGPLTRTVEDCALMMQALAGYDPLDPASADVPVPDYAEALTPRLDGVRIGVVRHFHEKDAVAGFGPESAPTATYVAAFDAACRTLEGLGARLVDLQLSPLIDYADTNRVIMLAEAYALHEKDFRERPQLFGRHMFARIGLGAFLSAADYVEAMRQRRELCARIRQRARRRRRRRFGQCDRPGAAHRYDRDLQHLRARLLHRAVESDRVAGAIGADRLRGRVAARLPDRRQAVRRGRGHARRLRLRAGSRILPPAPADRRAAPRPGVGDRAFAVTGAGHLV